MLTIALPDGRIMEFKHAVFDYNGTLATNGIIPEQVKKMLRVLSSIIHVTVLTADTFGLVRDQLCGIKELKIVIIGADEDGTAKAKYVQACGAQTVIAIGNGVNDRLMFEAAGLSICVIGREGASVKTLMSADIVITGIEDAIGLLFDTKGLVATLRC